MNHRFFFNKLFVLWSLLFFISCGREAPVTPEAAPGLENLSQALDAFNQAYARANVAALDKMLTAGYLHTNGATSSLDKEGWLRYVAGRRSAIDAGDLVIDRYSLLGPKIRLYGNAAVVSGKARISGLNQDGPFEHEYRVTELWVFDDSGWKRAAFHDGQVK